MALKVELGVAELLLGRVVEVGHFLHAIKVHVAFVAVGFFLILPFYFGHVNLQKNMDDIAFALI